MDLKLLLNDADDAPEPKDSDTSVPGGSVLGKRTAQTFEFSDVDDCMPLPPSDRRSQLKIASVAQINKGKDPWARARDFYASKWPKSARMPHENNSAWSLSKNSTQVLSMALYLMPKADGTVRYVTAEEKREGNHGFMGIHSVTFTPEQFEKFTRSIVSFPVSEFTKQEKSRMYNLYASAGFRQIFNSDDAIRGCIVLEFDQAIRNRRLNAMCNQSDVVPDMSGIPLPQPVTNEKYHFSIPEYTVYFGNYAKRLKSEHHAAETTPVAAETTPVAVKTTPVAHAPPFVAPISIRQPKRDARHHMLDDVSKLVVVDSLVTEGAPAPASVAAPVVVSLSIDELEKSEAFVKRLERDKDKGPIPVITDKMQDEIIFKLNSEYKKHTGKTLKVPWKDSDSPRRQQYSLWVWLHLLEVFGCITIERTPYEVPRSALVADEDTVVLVRSNGFYGIKSFTIQSTAHLELIQESRFALPFHTRLTTHNESRRFISMRNRRWNRAGFKDGVRLEDDVNKVLVEYDYRVQQNALLREATYVKQGRRVQIEESGPCSSKD